jgi:hypothetical protein
VHFEFIGAFSNLLAALVALNSQRLDSGGWRMAEKRSTALWRMATPLKRAWLELAAPEQRSAHEALPTLGQAVNPSAIPEGSGFWVRMFSAAAVMGQAYTTKTTSEGALKAELMRRIEVGEFELLGYRVEPTKGREPVVISASDLRKYPPDWMEESVAIRDEVYLDLRVSPAEFRKTGVKRGRPGSTEIILTTIDELCAKPNSDFCKIPRPQAAERVRELLRSMGIEIEQFGNGLSDQNIAKLILMRCPKRRIKIS